VSAFYATVTNSSDQPDRLLSAETPAAKVALLHQTMQMHDGMMHIEPIPDGIVIPAHGKVVLQGDGMHVMLNTAS
jgi:copper(I)-binding protein